MRLTRLYAIADADVCAAAGIEVDQAARAFAEAGVSHVQLRAKSADGRTFLALADRVATALRGTGATLVVNDRVDVAAAVGAGVHLGQHDLPAGEARRLLGPSAVIGRSTHTPEELARALDEPVSYVAFGPVFVTHTKANPDPVVGLEGLTRAAAAAHAAGRPLVAIGGITLATAPSVVAAGADAVAVISAICAADPHARARQFLAALET